MTIRVELRYGSAEITDEPTWRQTKAILRARYRALTDPSTVGELQSEAIRIFVEHWSVTDPKGRALEFPRDVDELALDDALALDSAIAAAMTASRVLEILGGTSSVNPTPASPSDTEPTGSDPTEQTTPSRLP